MITSDKTNFMLALSFIILYCIIFSIYNLSSNYGIFYFIVLLCSFYLISHKYLLLPFLGDTVIPQSLIIDSRIPNGADKEYKLKLGANIKDGVKVIYWASEKDENKIINNPWEAYGQYVNSGVTQVKDGEAILKYVNPTKYKVDGKTLPKHLHYRLCCDTNIMMGEVRTIDLEKQLLKVSDISTTTPN